MAAIGGVEHSCHRHSARRSWTGARLAVASPLAANDSEPASWCILSTAFWLPRENAPQTHNLKVAGSNPAPATKERPVHRKMSGFFCALIRGHYPFVPYLQEWQAERAAVRSIWFVARPPSDKPGSPNSVVASRLISFSYPKRIVNLRLYICINRNI